MKARELRVGMVLDLSETADGREGIEQARLIVLEELEGKIFVVWQDQDGEIAEEVLLPEEEVECESS